jgi:hypothetical protein
VLRASTDQDFDTAFESISRLGARGLVIHSSSAGALSSLRWRPVTRYPQFSDFVSSSRLGA